MGNNMINGIEAIKILCNKEPTQMAMFSLDILMLARKMLDKIESLALLEEFKKELTDPLLNNILTIVLSMTYNDSELQRDNSNVKFK